MCFRQFAPPKDNAFRMWHPDDMFTLVSPGSSEGKILHVSEEGPAVIYDADTRSTSTVPSLHGSWGCTLPMFIPIVGEGKETHSLYMIHDCYLKPSFKVLDFNEDPRKWQPLPRAPFAVAPDNYDDYNNDECNIGSVTVVDDDHTICVSTDSKGTYCFDTRSRKWWHAGDWSLPFDGRAEHVPELDAWIGFDSSSNYKLCASLDLSAKDASTLQHVWEDLRPPMEENEELVLNRRFLGAVVRRWKAWTLEDANLINLGGGRFCIAKVFMEQQVVHVGNGYDGHKKNQGPFIVLTGVEVLRGCNENDTETGLRMMKHKSKRYMSTDNEIKWVL